MSDLPIMFGFAPGHMPADLEALREESIRRRGQIVDLVLATPTPARTSKAKRRGSIADAFEGDRYGYRMLHYADCPVGARIEVKAALDAALELAGCTDRPTLRFFEQVQDRRAADFRSDDDLLGFAFGSVVATTLDRVDVDDLRAVVFHEVGHFAGLDEADARLFAETHAGTCRTGDSGTRVTR